MLDWSNITFIREVKQSYPLTAGYKDSDTSKEAAKKIDKKLGALHQQVLDALSLRPNGATADEIGLAIGILPHTARSRLGELKLAGKVIKTKRKGKSSLGGTCVIWEAIDTKEAMQSGNWMHRW